MRYQKEIHQYLQEHQEEMIAALAELISIRSVQGEATEQFPFGEKPAEALHKMLNFCENYGFSVENVENFAGSAELNEKEPELGILTHLDVVPEGEGWTFPPFSLTVDSDSGKLFGRGTSDDKGLAIAALFALRAVKELAIPMRAGVRLIFGTNEENGSADLEHYLQKKTLPPMVFTPDGDYPVINIEKGMIRLNLTACFDCPEILSFQAGNAPNAVPAKASATVQNISVQSLAEQMEQFPEVHFILSPEKNQINIIAEGKSAHASTPEQGVNALTALLTVLAKTTGNVHLQKLAECCQDTNGNAYGIAMQDELSGALTFVCSMMKIKNHSLTVCHDIRFPLCGKGENIIKTIQEKLAGLFSVEVQLCDAPHYTNEHSVFVQKLLKVYETVTGLKGECLAIGGGTYVHHIEGGVAFGAVFPGEDVHMHGADEYIRLDHLLKDAEMIALAMTELCGKEG